MTTRPPSDRAVFLSASIPDPKRNRLYHETANVPAIRAAVIALVTVVLGKRKIVWGGHPSITPLIRLAADSLNLNYGDCVTLYQSRFFQDDFPQENKKFRNVIYTKALEDMASSVRLMRKTMIKKGRFSHAVFIGGMEGVEEEYRLVKSIDKAVTMIPVASTGGAALSIFQSDNFPEKLLNELTFASLFETYFQD